MKPSLDEWLRFVVGVTMALTLVGIVGGQPLLVTGTPESVAAKLMAD